MANIKKLISMVEKYDKKHAKPEPDYNINRDRLRKLVKTYGIISTAVATGFAESTIKQHCNNKNGTAMISSYRLERAESVLAEV